MRCLRAVTLLSLLMLPSLARAEEPIVMKIATVAPNDTPWADLLKKYQQDVEKQSDGRIKVKLFLGGTLGDENESVLKCKRGQIEAAGASTGAIASQVPEINVVELPYLFRSAEEADDIIDNVVTPELDKVFPGYGLILGFWSENGFRHFGTKDGFVKSPANLKGKTMRAQESPIHMAMYRIYGAQPNPIPTTEVLTALQNGTVDGYDQALLYAIAASWYKSAKFVTLSSHIYQPAAIVFNQAWFAKLPKDLQQIVVDNGRRLQTRGRKGVRAMHADLVKILEEEGVQVYELTPAEKARFEEVALPVRKEYRKMGKTSAAILDKVEAALAKYRKK